MAKMFAWSHIHFHDDKGRKVAKPGTEVSADSLGLDEEGFKALVEAGSVRSTPWPKGLNPDNPSAPSPNQYRLQQLRARVAEVEAELNSPGGESTAPATSDAGENKGQ